MRPDGWEARLAVAIELGARRRFAWGEHDCVTFAWACASAVLRAPTPWDAWMIGWTDRAEAVRALRAAGSLAQAMDAGGARRALAYARRGDVAMLRLGRDGEPEAHGRAALAVIDGRTLIMPAARGLRRFPAPVALACWGVG